MLAAAQVDFLYFDVTNAFTYKAVYDKLLAVFDDVRRQGWDVPQVVFYTNARSGDTIEQLYEDLYQPGRYRELWFELDGKPLIIGDPDEVSPEVRDFFTFRRNQWPNEPMKENGFPWISFTRPQQVFEVDGEPDIVNVAAAVHNNFPFSDQPFYGAGNNWSRSFHDGSLDPAPDAYKWGYNFSEQWEHALEVDPRIVAVTGWNEWVAQRFTGDFPGWDGNPDRPEDRPVFFVDQATTEFSRDLEPMKAGTTTTTTSSWSTTSGSTRGSDRRRRRVGGSRSTSTRASTNGPTCGRPTATSSETPCPVTTRASVASPSPTTPGATTSRR